MQKTNLRKSAIGSPLLFAVIAILAAICIFPLLWILSTSFKSESEEFPRNMMRLLK